MPEKVEFTFNGDEPEDLTFKVTLGEDPAKATEVAVLVGNSILSSDYVTLSGNTVTIKKEILQELTAGTYQFSVVFNDTNLTTVDDMLTVNIYNSHPSQPAEETPEDGENTETEVDADGTDGD